MKRLTKLFRVLIPVIIVFMLVVVPIFAIAYTATFTVDNNTTTDYAMLPVISTVDNTYLAANGYMAATALDTRVETEGGSAKSHMVASDKTLAATAIEANSQLNLQYTTGNTALTSMDIVTGYNGYLEIDDAAALEIGNNFLLEFDGYYDSSTSDFKIHKLGATSLLYSNGVLIGVLGADTDNRDAPFYGTNWAAQTFTTVGALSVNSVTLKLLVSAGTPTGTMTVSIRAVDGAHKPTGADLTSGTFNVTKLNALGNWHTIDLTPYTLSATTEYAVVLRHTTGDVANAVGARDNNAGSTYAGGAYCTSNNSGSTWTVGGTDLGFVVGDQFSLLGTISCYDAVTTGEYTTEFYADASDLFIDIDGANVATVGLGGTSAPDNAYNWILRPSSYWNYYEHTVAGTLIAQYQPVAIIANTSYDGTADAGGDANTIIDAELTQVDDYWNYALVTITDTTDDAAPKGETAYVFNFASATDEITLDRSLTAGVDVGDTYTVEFGTLPDREGVAQNARIGWGVNPTDVSVTLGIMVSQDQSASVITTETPSTEILPEISVNNWYEEPDVTGTLLTNPLRPFVTILSDTTSLSEMQSWRLLGIAFVLFVTVASIMALRGHLIVAGVSCGVSTGAMVALTIFPLWALIFAIGAIVAGVIAERSPSI